MDIQVGSILHISANRKAVKYSKKDLLKRILWTITSPLFHYSPRIMFEWRNYLLRMFGAKVGQHVHIYHSARIYMPWNLVIGDESAIGEDALIYNLGHVMIGEQVTISHRAHICSGTHDHEDPEFPLLKPGITIGNQVWVGTDAYIGPGIKVGKGSVVGARSVVVKDVPEWKIVVGNPGKAIKERIINK